MLLRLYTPRITNPTTKFSSKYLIHTIRMVIERSATQFGGRSPIKAHRNPILQNHLQQRGRRQNELAEDDPIKLEAVDFSGMSLHHLPNPSIINLPAISKLDLSNNNLEMIPESIIARMVNVVELDVHSNQLTTLPNSIGCLSKLKILNASANLLHSLPTTIDNCRSLEELNANFNNLASLPGTIGFELINLKKLSVNSNKIVFLPYSTSHLTALRVLDVRLNSLKSLPDDIENLTNLQLLDVSQNFHHLSELPDSTGLLQSLLELDASYNTITTLPPSVACLQKLQKLSLEGNPLVSPPMEVVELGLHRVRSYLTEKMNSGGPDGKHKKSLFGRLKKHGPSNANNNDSRRRVPRRNPIEAIASPRYFSMLSPNRWFSSPQHSFSRLS